MGRKMSDFQEDPSGPKLTLDVTPGMIAKAYSLGVPADAISIALHALEIYVPRLRKISVAKRITAIREGTD